MRRYQADSPDEGGGGGGDLKDAHLEEIYKALAAQMRLNGTAADDSSTTAVTAAKLSDNSYGLSFQDEESFQRIKCNFRGEKRIMSVVKPVRYVALMEKIVQYYGNHVQVYYQPPNSVRPNNKQQQQDTTSDGFMITCQDDLNESLRIEQKHRPASSSLHIHLVPLSTNQIAQIDRESPPPGTEPTRSDGVFIPDEDDAEYEILSCTTGSQSGSRSSLDSSYYSTQSVMSAEVGSVSSLMGRIPPERVRGGTYPLTRVGNTGVGMSARVPPNPSTYPQHSRRSVLNTTGSFGSLLSGTTEMSVATGTLISVLPLNTLTPPNPSTYPKHSRRSVLNNTGSFGSLLSGTTEMTVPTGGIMKSPSMTGSFSNVTGIAQKSPRRSPGQWRMGRRLGGGVFGQVYLCCDAETGKEMAVKQIRVNRSNEETWKEVRALQSEIQLLKSVQHDCLVQYLGSAEDPSAGLLSVFLEYMAAGSVKDQIKEYGPLKEKVASSYTRQVLDGLIYLHQLMIVHRNIKGANILRDHSGNVKLTEFGISKRLQAIVVPSVQSGASSSNPVNQSDDSLHIQSIMSRYMAPEVIEGKGYGRKADIWSLGCTVVEMLTGSPPWFQQVDPHSPPTSSPPPSPIYRLPDSSTRNASNFIGQCFILQSTNRPTAEDLLNHQFCNL